MSEDEFKLKELCKKRVSRFKDNYVQYTTAIVSMQNNNTMKKKPSDVPINLIDTFIHYYTNCEKSKLRLMISG